MSTPQNVANLLSALYQRGVRVWAEGGQIHYQARSGRLRSEELSALRLFKCEILELLEQEQLLEEIPLRPRPADSVVPLEDAQRLMWDLMIKGGSQLSERLDTTAVRVVGALSITRLRESLEAVLHRHESLRTRIVVVDDILRQQVDKACTYDLERIDLSSMSASAGAAEVRRLAGEFAEAKIDLSVGPLFEAKLLTLSDQEHVLVLALDSMISDGMSNEILIGDIWKTYEQMGRRPECELPKLPVQLADYAVWQACTYGSWLKQHGNYWRMRLANAPAVQLPTDRGLENVNPETGAKLEFFLGGDLSAKLRDLARRERTLLALVMLTVYVAAMSRLCDQGDLVVQLVENGRYRWELENIVGPLIHVLHLRIELRRDDSWADLLGRITREFYSACAHRDFNHVPFMIPDCGTDLHVNWLPAGPAHGFAFRQPATAREIAVQPFPQPFPVRRQVPPLKFLPYFADTAAGIRVTMVYRAEMFGGSTVEGVCRNLRLFAQEFSEHPRARAHVRA